MPELPEVEDAARRLARAVRGRTITALQLRHPALARALPDADRARVIGRQVVRVERRGKHQLLWLEDGSALDVHFRMSGDWSVAAAAPEHPWMRALVTLDDGSIVALVDPRALSVLRLHRAGADSLPALGPDPLDPRLDAGTFARALVHRRGAIKPVLLDQHVIAGIGNIYAAEALWLARISPRTRASALGARRVARLLAAMRRALRSAPAARHRGGAEGSAARADTSPGEDAPRWRVYDRAGRPCRRCGAHIRRIVQAGRSTYYCPRCQRT